MDHLDGDGARFVGLVCARAGMDNVLVQSDDWACLIINGGGCIVSTSRLYCHEGESRARLTRNACRCPADHTSCGWHPPRSTRCRASSALASNVRVCIHVRMPSSANHPPGRSVVLKPNQRHSQRHKRRNVRVSYRLFSPAVLGLRILGFWDSQRGTMPMQTATRARVVRVRVRVKVMDWALLGLHAHARARMC